MSHSIRDEDLVAYLDGEIDAARRREIEAALASSRDLNSRLAAINLDKEALRVAFGAVAAAAPADRIRRQLDADVSRKEAQPTPSRWRAIAAALIGGVALGYAVGLYDVNGQPASWHTAIANYQSLYTNATLAPIASDPARQERDVADVSEKLGLPIGLDELQVPGLDFKRAQLLGFRGQPLAQFSYLDNAGVPIAFCATPTGEADSVITQGTFGELNAVYWSRRGFGFIVIGATPAAALLRAAAVLAAQV
jgi:anti-sigma factor RsiW